MSAELISILLVLIGAIISFYGSIVGFGGGIFMVPILVTFFNFPMDIAAGTAMISLFPSTLLSTLLNKRQGHVDFKMGLLLELPTTIGVILGSLLLTFLAANGYLSILETLFAIMILSLGISFFFKQDQKSTHAKGLFYKLNKLKPGFIIKNRKNHIAYRISLYMNLIFGLSAGALAGLFGVGGGFLKTPIMYKVFKIPAKIAAATALFMITMTSLIGSASHYWQGHIIWQKAWPVALGFSIGAAIGYKVNAHIKEKSIAKMIGFSLIAAALMMFINFML